MKLVCEYIADRMNRIECIETSAPVMEAIYAGVVICMNAKAFIVF